MNPLFRFPIAQRPLRIATPQGPDALAVLELEGREGVSELFDFRLRLAADRFTLFDFQKLLGQSVTLHIATPDLGARVIHGLVCELERVADDQDLAYYNARIVPQWHLARLSSQCRVFQQQSVPEILTTVLAGMETKRLLSRQYPQRDYCVQYNETDFDFATRLLEEEGIFYYFEHRSDGHTLVLADDVATLPEATLVDTMLFEADAGGVRRLPRVWQWSKSQQLVTTKFTRRDQCFEMFGQTFEADASLSAEAEFGTQTHALVCREDDQEVYEYPGGYAKWFDGVQSGGGDQAADLQQIFQQKDRVARLQAEATASGAVRAAGESNCLRLLPGQRFALAQQGWGDGKYFLLSIQHHASLRVPARSSDEGLSFTYENKLTALPDALPYRPQCRTAKPRIVGPQTATVTGPEGQEIFCDKYGRVKVLFPWDRLGPHDAGSSCWVRVAQFWAGKRFGAFFWPRIGQEVVIAFEDGDPDRPLIVGSVYNSANMPPLEMPADEKITGIKSCIYGGDPLKNFNAVIFHDTPGNEYVQVHSETHAMQNSKSDHYEFVPSVHFSFHGSLM
jgi:type VI secretion system secreted protein VgrG